MKYILNLEFNKAMSLKLEMNFNESTNPLADYLQTS